MFRDSTVSEALSMETIRVLEANRKLINDQMNQLTDGVLSYLEDICDRQRNSINYPLLILGGGPGLNGINAYKSYYTLPLLRLLEKGLSQELEGLYEYLKILRIAWEFIQVNSPFIDSETSVPQEKI
jgi:hypothetical protein